MKRLSQTRRAGKDPKPGGNWSWWIPDWPNSPQKTHSVDDVKDGFPKIWKELLTLPSLVAEGKYSWDWINETTTFTMLQLKAPWRRHWLIRLRLFILFSPSRRTTYAEVWHMLGLNHNQVGEVSLFQILPAVSGTNWYADQFQGFDCECLH